MATDQLHQFIQTELNMKASVRAMYYGFMQRTVGVMI